MAHDEAYYQAEKKIEEALKLGTTELDLSCIERLEAHRTARIAGTTYAIKEVKSLQQPT